MKFQEDNGPPGSGHSQARREFYIRLLLVAAVLTVFAILALVLLFRPRLDADRAEAREAVADEGKTRQEIRMAAAKSEVGAIKSKFLDLLESGPFDMDSLSELERAIDLQRDLASDRSAPPGAREELDQLLQLYDEQMGLFLAAQSDRLETEAERLHAAGELAEGLSALERARNIQEEINRQYPRASSRDPARQHRLNNRLINWRTAPMAEQADALRETAFEYLANERYAEARDLMQEALSVQRQLNESYRNSPWSTLSRLKDFEGAWKRVSMAEDAARVSQLLQEGRQHLQADRTEEALKHAEQAEALQTSLMERFPGLPETRPGILHEIRVVKESASSKNAYQELVSQREQVRNLLREADADSVRHAIADWYRDAEAFSRRFPLSNYRQNIDLQEISYLYEHRDTIPALFDAVYGRLLPVPGHEGLRMYQTEVPQMLYQLVTGTNPSSNRHPQKPVDSVTWEEAKRFTQLLSWLLARPVSLPARAHYLAALGNPSGQKEPWSSRSSGRETQLTGTSPANAHGFHDLLGNVAEWMADGSSDNSSVAIGGSARDPADRLLTIPEEVRPRDERNRFVGLRFIMEMND